MLLLLRSSEASGTSQALAVALDDVIVAVEQTESHDAGDWSQALAITLDDVVVSVAQNRTGNGSQALAVTLDGISVSISSLNSSAPTGAGHGHAYEHRGRIEYFKDEDELQRFLAAQETTDTELERIFAKPMPKPVNVASAFGPPSVPRQGISIPELAPLNRRARRAIANDDEDAILLLLS